MATPNTPSRHDRKKIRLDPSIYAQAGLACSLTIAVHGRRPIFSDSQNAEKAIDVLSQLAERHEVSVYGYCVMPDHVHLVLGPSPNCDVITFVSQFKNLTQRAVWERGVVGVFWQKSFWDHFVRDDEGLERTVLYVLGNPVRKGLVAQWREYPYAGSLALKI